MRSALLLHIYKEITSSHDYKMSGDCQLYSLLIALIKQTLPRSTLL